MNILKNVFSTFGNLIDIYLLPNKNCGYIKYGTVESAQRAIELLNGAEIMDARMKTTDPNRNSTT
uniref:RRM domain-containing protein n=1 Tax=Megaselia scalaris TaxID=36166 RepID=T1GYX3_MEGSC